jgi:hypothetical protein
MSSQDHHVIITDDGTKKLQGAGFRWHTDRTKF